MELLRNILMIKVAIMQNKLLKKELKEYEEKEMLHFIMGGTWLWKKILSRT